MLVGYDEIITFQCREKGTRGYCGTDGALLDHHYVCALGGRRDYDRAGKERSDKRVRRMLLLQYCWDVLTRLSEVQ